jgi:uncharacterized membrane protein
MKKIGRVLVFGVILFLTFMCLQNRVNADSYLYLNSLEFYVEVNQDASINVTEYWNIDIEETNTLYKSFKTDNTKYTGITDVIVTDITNGVNKQLLQQNKWEYHVDKGKYYGTTNKNGDFEIGWGVGLDNSYDTRQYKIQYKVENAIAKYNDYAELYWQLIGEDFEISADEVTGTIILPEDASSKEEIKVWGHIETLNGTIYATDLNTIEFEVNGYDSNHMLEIRTLFPTEMIFFSSRTKNIDILQTVIEEETKWAEEANNRREARIVRLTAIIVVGGLILDIIFIITIISANKNPIRKQKKFIPEQEMEYYREIPRKNATPGEAVQLIQKNMTNMLNSYALGKIFSAVLLNLKLKGYLEFEIDETKKDKEKITLRLDRKSKAEELDSEEKEVYAFLDQATLKKDERVLNLKELQKVIKSNPEKIQKLNESMGKNIYNSLIEKNLLDEKQSKDHTTSTAIVVLQIVFLIMFLGFVLLFVTTEEIGFNIWIKATLAITSILGVISIAKKIGIVRKSNPFTQNGVNEIEAWKGLKKYMEDFSLLNEKEVPAIETWEQFLVYATAFGIAEKVIKQLKMAYPNYEQLAGSDYTMMYLMMNTDFSSSFSSAISSTMSSTYSSATGGGGGFSGGCGGGGGRRWRWRTLDILLSRLNLNSKNIILKLNKN